MSFEIRDENQEVLTTESVRRLISDLQSNGSITVSVYTDQATTAPGIYLKPSSDMGEVDYPSLNSPHTDYSDILLYGSDEINPTGLKVTKVENGVEEEVFFNFEQGASYKNMILLPQLAGLSPRSYAAVKISYVTNPSISSRRFYIGLEINDSQ